MYRFEAVETGGQVGMFGERVQCTYVITLEASIDRHARVREGLNAATPSLLVRSSCTTLGTGLRGSTLRTVHPWTTRPWT